MTGETNLNTLLGTMSADLIDDLFVFVTLKDRTMPDGLSPRMMFQEAEGITLILTQAQAQAHDLPFEFPCRMITLNIHSALEAVGFIAHIATELAKQDMGVNPVAGFFHDHLFVPDGREQDALTVISKIAAAHS
ncbi:ACT domain-containing protein [Pseudosulfitobacter sp. SM2401]|uniref:ACT domain-containing protein n=1 Tax=Pseudosulfitobacter sp. SM2401 TaxID=3350098 RepID=UPI0036F1E1E8